MQTLVSYKNEIQNISLVSTIVFISDLHFDFVEGKFYEARSEETKKMFIAYVKNNYKQSIVCILGDCFNDWKKVLLFIKELEKEQIRGFFVLGNHDYWNDKTKSYKEILDIFEKETRDNEYFRLLITGRKYYIGELCFIGDTGWTSFVKNGKQVNLYQFKKQPDANYVKDFSPKQIRSFHDNWINYANTILEQEEKVIMLTHYPMTCFANESKECWWSSETKLKEMKDCWKIFGHTHKSRQRRGNNISSQRGYSKNKNKEDLERLKIKQYTEQDFGMLIKTADSSKLQIIDVESLKNFYNPCLIENPNSQMELVKEVKKRGFNRASKSLKILGKLASDPYEYIRDIKLIMNDYEKSIHIGYRYMFDLSEKTIYAIHTAIASLERIFEKDDFSNPMIFVTSAIITGYVYNHIATQIDNMRPVDYYDIIRFYLVFQTMKKYELDFEDISVRKHCSRSITVKNMKIELPAINKKCMTVDEAYACFKGTSLLPENNMIE